VTGDGSLNIYRKEVCNQAVFGSECGLSDEFSDMSSRMPAPKFAEEFLRANSLRSLSREDFERYVAWVMRDTSGSRKSTLTLLALEPDLRRLNSVELPSIEAAYQWMQNHQPPPPSSTPSYGPSGP
jgi:hypothetical protein